MKLVDIPNRKANNYPCKISIALSPKTKNRLDLLKQNGKDTAQLVRMLIDEFLETIDFEDEAS